MSKEKVGLYITTMLHEITQLGYGVEFASDFEGMVRIDYTKEYDKDFYDHDHIGTPGQDRLALEKGIIESLRQFLENHRTEKPQS